MKQIRESKENNNNSLNSIDINDLSSFLEKSGFIQKCFFSKTHLQILNYNASFIQNLCNDLQFDEHIIFDENSNSYNNIISSFNKTFKNEIPIKDLYNQYVYYTKANITLNIFYNWIVIFDVIISNFSKCFNFEKSGTFHNIIKNKIDMIDINYIYSDFHNNNRNTNQLENLYKNIERQPIHMGKRVNSDLIITIYLFSIENKLTINKDIPNISVIMKYFELYNKTYFSNIYFSLLTYVEIIILINLHLYSNKNKKNYFEYNPDCKNNLLFKNMDFSESNNISFFSPQKNVFYKKKKNDSINEIANIKLVDNNILTFYLFDNEMNNYLYDSSTKIFMFQNYLKLYSFFHLSKNKVKIRMNLTIDNIPELMKRVNKSSVKMNVQNVEQPNSARTIHGPLAPNNNFAENLKNYIKVNQILKSSNREKFDQDNGDNDNKSSIFPKLDLLSEIQSQNINLIGLKIMNKNNLNLCFNNFTIEQLLIKLVNSMDLSHIRKINTNYIDFILNSNRCYFQQSIFSFPKNNNDKENEINDSSVMLTPRGIPQKNKNLLTQNKSDNIIDNLSIDDFFDECGVLYYFLDSYNSIDIKKLPQVIQIKLNTFKCNINQKTKTIQIYFNFSYIKEKKLFQFLKESKGMLIFIQKYQFIIRALKEYKLYQCTMRVSQTNFRSNQLNYFFTFITHKLVDFIEEIKYNKIVIYETQLNTYNPNMKVYLRDFYLKKKPQIANLKAIIQSFPFFNKIKVIMDYINIFVDLWDLIVISDSDKDIKLLRTFDDNKIFFFITKENDLNDNQNKSSVNVININDNKNNKKDKSINKGNNSSSIGKSREYEYLNIIIYIKNNLEDFSKIVNTIQSLVVNKNSVLDYKTNLICDRFFFEYKILLDPRMQQLQASVSSLIDDFFFITKKNGPIDINYINIKTNKHNTNNKEYKPSNDVLTNNNSASNEYYNYDFFIGDDYVGVLNNHQYDFSIDYENNFNQLIYQYLSVLSSCLELIYFLLKSKNIFILRFVYIIRTKNDCYYSWEYKNGNIFIKRIKDFNSLFTLNIKNSIPLFCFLSKKERDNQNNGENTDDNFYDVFIRLFLNLNKVAKNQDLNKEFLKKIHKNIFRDSSFDLVAFSYEAFIFFNDFFINNDYLEISNGEKFEKCNIIPIEGYFDSKNYMKIISIFNSKEKNIKSIVKNVHIFNFGINFNYLYKNKTKILFGFSKIDYFINEYNNYIFNHLQYDYKKKKDIIKKKFEEKIINKQSKKNINKYLKKIQEFTFGNYGEEMNDSSNGGNVLVFNSHIDLYDLIIEDYIKEKMIIRTQKNELNVFQMEDSTQDNKNEKKDKKNIYKKDCIIF